jgi:hypothetical protein
MLDLGEMSGAMFAAQDLLPRKTSWPNENPFYYGCSRRQMPSDLRELVSYPALPQNIFAKRSSCKPK